MGLKPAKPDYDRMQKAQAAIVKINNELTTAIAFERNWNRIGNRADIIDAVNSRTHSIPAFRLLRDAVHASIVHSLMRIYDHDDQRNATIPFMLKILSDPRVQAAFVAHYGRQMATIMAKNLAAAEKLFKARSTRTYLGHLRRLRHQHLAHHAIKQKPTTAKYGHERKLLLRTIRIVAALNVATANGVTDFKATRAMAGRHADQFWSRVILGMETKG